MRTIKLNHKETVSLAPLAPYNFDATFHKPAYFPSSDNAWEEGKFRVTMLWRGQELGLKFENRGTTDKPEIEISIYSREALTEDYLDSLVSELRWRYNLDSDISGFYEKYHDDEILGPIIEKWKGMKPRAAVSLYETLIIYIVLQNATVRRTVQMMENLFERFGNKLEFDGKTLSALWEPQKMAEASEQELRDIKLGYRAKFLKRITDQFVNKEIDEFALRKMSREEVRTRMLKLYGIGPASVDYLLFEHFYFYDKLETVPPWEQKIISRLVFDEELVDTDKILAFFRKFEGWEKLAFNYIWEDVFWRRKHEHIDWLEKEIRL
jgi:3-methyladenine DNA glycosylase/8-oxoguanine DNA glycosylase